MIVGAQAYAEGVPDEPPLLDGSLTRNREAIEALLFSAAAGEHLMLRGQDPTGSWAVTARLTDAGQTHVSFELANNTAIWSGALADIDGNLTLWGEFEMHGSPQQALDRLIALEAEAHRLAYLVGDDG